MIVGQRKQPKTYGTASNSSRNYAKVMTESFRAIKEETGVDLYKDPSAITEPIIRDTMEKQFIDNNIANEEELTPEELEAETNMLKEQFNNTVEMIMEHTALGQHNPLIAMTLPVQKNLMMNTIFDKGSIQKAVAVSPAFNISMKRRFLVTPEGKKLDLAKDQSKLRKAIADSVPFVNVELALPELGTTDVLSAIGATRKDDLSVETHICEVLFADVPQFDDEGKPTGTTEDQWIATKLTFSSAYGGHNRTIMGDVKYTLPDGECLIDTISASMKDNTFLINSMRGLTKAVKLRARRDTSSGMNETPTSRWEMEEEFVQIPDAPYLSTTISIEEVKDIAALYGVDQTAEILEIFKDTMGNYKDDTIKLALDEGFNIMDDFNKRHEAFDLAPTDNFMGSPVAWRKEMFMELFDTVVTDMLEILNDPNMSVCTYGRTNIIRRIQPTEYNYETPASIGPVTLDYNKVVTTSNNRKYSFLSSQKIKDDNLITLLRPEATNKIIYRIYDYQFYVGNDIRNYANHTLPSISTFERFLLKDYEPVQGRISILNPDGFRPNQRPTKDDLIPVVPEI